MRPDALATLLKLRRLTVESTRAALAEALHRQDMAEGELMGAEQAIRSETERATDTDAEDGIVETFAAWLPSGRRRMAEAQLMVDHAVAQAAQARAALALARAALEAAEALEDDARMTAREAAGRAEQEAVDEAARRARALP